jgi:hypothetical protein
LAGVRISELPVVTVLQDSDVIVLNENNIETSSIETSFFISSLFARDITVTGDFTFAGKVIFNNEVTFNDVVDFNSQVDFYDRVVVHAELDLVGNHGLVLNTLEDVDTETTLPTEGQTLVWDDSDKQWYPGDAGRLNDVFDDKSPTLGGDLDVNGFGIVSTNNGDVYVAAHGAGSFYVNGNSHPGEIRLRDVTNTKYVGVASPKTFISSSYTLHLPDNKGGAGYALVTDGLGNTDWRPVLTDDGGRLITFSDLEVQINPTPADGGDLEYDDTTGTFTFTPAESGLGNIDLTGVQVNDILVYDGTDWVIGKAENVVNIEALSVLP